MYVRLTKREMEKLVEHALLEAGEVTITPKGRNIIGLFLMLAGGALTPLPVVGWVLGPAIAFLAKMGFLEDYVADYIQGRTDLESLINSIEKRVGQILMATPKGRAVINHLASLAIKSDPTGQMQREVRQIVTGEVATPTGVLGVTPEQEEDNVVDLFPDGDDTPEQEIDHIIKVKLASIYITDAILQMVQKNIKLNQLTIRGKKLKLPGKKMEGGVGGLITIDKKDLPARYQPLHGIINQIADPTLDSAGALAFEQAVEIADNDEYDDETFELSGDIEGVSDELNPFIKPYKSTGGATITPPDPDIVTEDMKDLFDTVDMIGMINEARYSKDNA